MYMINGRNEISVHLSISNYTLQYKSNIDLNACLSSLQVITEENPNKSINWNRELDNIG